MANEFFKTRLKMLINERYPTNAEFARDVSVDPSAVSHYLRGVAEPQLSFLIDIADHFGVSADWLMGRTEDRFSHRKKNTPNN